MLIKQITAIHKIPETGRGGKPKTLIVHAKAFSCDEPFPGWGRFLEFLDEGDRWTIIRDGDALLVFEKAAHAGLQTWGTV